VIAAPFYSFLRYRRNADILVGHKRSRLRDLAQQARLWRISRRAGPLRGDPNSFEGP